MSKMNKEKQSKVLVKGTKDTKCVGRRFPLLMYCCRCFFFKNFLTQLTVSYNSYIISYELGEGRGRAWRNISYPWQVTYMKLDKHVIPRLPKYENNKYSYTFTICYWKETYPKTVSIIVLFFFFFELLR